MRNLRKKCLILLFVIGLPVLSYPFTTISESSFDFGIYTGRSVMDESGSASGTPLGIFGGVSFGITFIRAGVHFFADSTVIDNFSRTSMGLSGRFQLAIPIIPVEPYIKIGTGIIDVFSTPGSVADRKFFSTVLYGAGVEVSLIPYIKPFGEYTYWNSKWNGNTAKNHAINFGVKIAM
ncbi:MAG TPA: hypothetical protein DHW82_10885 [Spirochaetia bacterium]|nr:MAG: hypothetical protein A2Y41_11560 [Spirochaetes bacterium GWB1_36_13]HCL57498.1 hypothetical protein [Spirochaetia bacterium]